MGSSAHFTPPVRTGVFSDAGWHARARRVPSPNADDRPAGTRVELVVIHNISLPPGRFGGDAVERLFTNTLSAMDHPYYAGIAALKVSAHFFISRTGALTQFVSTDHRAWHAGVSSWRRRGRCNDFSVGIELEGTDEHPYTLKQYRRLAALNRALIGRYPSIQGVCGHSEIAPGRKTDPGQAFDWRRFMVQSGLPQRFRRLA